MKAEIKLTNEELTEVIVRYVKQRTGYAATDVTFRIEEKTEGDQRDSWKVTFLKDVTITVELPSNII